MLIKETKINKIRDCTNLHSSKNTLLKFTGNI